MLPGCHGVAFLTIHLSNIVGHIYIYIYIDLFTMHDNHYICTIIKSKNK